MYIHKVFEIPVMRQETRQKLENFVHNKSDVKIYFLFKRKNKHSQNFYFFISNVLITERKNSLQSNKRIINNTYKELR